MGRQYHIQNNMCAAVLEIAKTHKRMTFYPPPLWVFPQSPSPALTDKRPVQFTGDAGQKGGGRSEDTGARTERTRVPLKPACHGRTDHSGDLGTSLASQAENRPEAPAASVSCSSSSKHALPWRETSWTSGLRYWVSSGPQAAPHLLPPGDPNDLAMENLGPSSEPGFGNKQCFVPAFHINFLLPKHKPRKKHLGCHPVIDPQ